MATRVLFVDQSALIQKMAVQAFSQQKIEVVKVASGDLATWLINQINPDLVIADVSVPDKSGYELCQYIKDDARLSHIPVILLYWPDETFDYAKANGARADAYLTKPFESQTLIETAQSLLQNGSKKGVSFAPPAPPLPDLESVPTVSDEPLDISDVFEKANFKSYSQAAASESDFPLVLEDAPAPSNNAVEREAGQQPLMATANDRGSAADQRSRSGKKKAALALAAMAVLALALTPWLWKSTGVHETQSDLSPPASNPQSEPQPKTDSAASNQSSQPVSPAFTGDRRSNNPAASGFKAKDGSIANRYEDRQINNANAVDQTASRTAKPAALASNQPALMPENSNRVEQSLPRIIPGNATAPALPNVVKPGSASQQTLEPVNGFKQIGSQVKGAVVWSGKKAGRGLKAIGRGLKKAFTHDSKID